MTAFISSGIVTLQPILILLKSTVMCRGEYRRGYRLDNGFIDHFQVVTIITTLISTLYKSLCAKSSQSAVSSPDVSW
jgi:hypothetical protein